MAQDTNLNITPYFDDFDADKNFHRVLFRPSFPIQARELTQLQTILQDQIERFGQNIFKIGTVISGCGIIPEPRYSYVKFNDIDVDNFDVNISAFSNCYATDTATGLKALITNTSDGLQSNANGALKTAYVKYVTAGSDQAQYAFTSNTNLLIQKTTAPIEDIVVETGGEGYTNSMYVNVTQTSPAPTVNAYARLITNANGVVTGTTIINAGEGYTKEPIYITGNVVYANGTAVPASVANNATFAFVNYVSRPVVNSTGFGYGLRVSDGIIFQKGFFIRSEAQEIIVSKYSTTNSGQPNNVVVGFTTVESIVNSAVDDTLLDNASGFTNYQAPGADRLKLTPTLALKSVDDLTEATGGVPPVENFFVLVEFQDGKIVRDKTATQFNSVDTELARRTYEESGDYVVDQITLDTEDAAEIYANTTTYANTVNVIVGRGVAYVQGRRNELKNAYRVNIPKSNTVISKNNQIISTAYEKYVEIYLPDILGTLDVQEGELINIYSDQYFQTYNRTFGWNFIPGVTPLYPGVAIPADLSLPTLLGTPIGTARVRAVNRYYSEFIRLHLFDVKFNSGQDNQYITVFGKDGKFVARSYVGELFGSENENIVFNAGLSAISGISDEQFDYTKHWANVSVTSSGSATFSTSSQNTTFLYTGSLIATQKQNFVIIAKDNLVTNTYANGTFAVANTGHLTRLTGTLSSTDVPRFDSENDTLSWTCQIINNANTAQSFFTQIYSAYGNTFYTSLGENWNNYYGYSNTIPSEYQYANASIAYAFPKNSCIPTSMVDITITNSNSAVIDFKYGTWANVSGSIDVYAHVTAQNSEFTHTTLASNTFYVKIDMSVANANPSGPWCLGVPNVYKIDGVWVGSGNTFADENLAANQKNNFLLDNGQKDSFYGLAYLKTKPGTTLTLTGKNLLVKASCFTVTSANAYISVESYTGAANIEYIPIYTTKQGEVISLRDAIDFRPIVSNTVVRALSAATANVINAASYSTFTAETLTISNKYFPTPTGTFRCDVDHFVPRRDRVIIDKKGDVKVVTGIPSITPTLPKVPDNVMIIGDIYLPPYPSLPYYRALEVDRLDYAIVTSFKQQQRYTMKDIQEIENRIEDLEYYSSLNTLETKTQGLSITSENNETLERFKYGFLVDPMKDTLVSNSLFVNTTFEIEPVRQVATPSYLRAPLKLKSVSNSSTQIYTVLPTESRPGKVAMLGTSALEVGASFTRPTKQRNLVEGFVKFSGNIIVVPPVDASTTVSPSGATIVIPNTGTFTNQTIVTGINLNSYIRAQSVYLRCTGLMPNRRHYVFFDGDPVSNTCASASFYANGQGFATSARGVALTTNASGGINIQLNIPANTYIVGEREIVVMDVDNLLSENASVSIAKENFSGYGATVITSNLITDPLAQTFKVQKVTAGGKYIKRLQTLFARKAGAQSTPPSAGVMMHLRKTVNGYPTGPEGTIARKYLPAANVNVLPTTSLTYDESLFTTFEFDNPVFIESDVEYAVVLQPDGNTPDYLAWVGKVGENVFATNQQYTTQDGTPGILFQSTNDTAWSPIQSEDLVYKLYTIRFVSTSGNVVLSPRDYEFITYGIKQNKSFDYQISGAIGQISSVYCDGQISVNSTSALVTGFTPTSSGTDFVDPTPVGNTYHTLLAVSSSNIASFALGSNNGLAAGQGVIVLRVEPTMATQLDANNRFNVANGSANVVAANLTIADITTGSNKISVGDFVVISTKDHGNTFSTESASNSSVIRQVVSITSNTEFVIDAPVSANTLANVCVWVANNVKSFISTVNIQTTTGADIVLDKFVPTSFAANSTGSTGTTNVAIALVKAPIGTISLNDTLVNQLQIEDSSASISTGIKFRASNSTFLGTLISTTYTNNTIFTTHLANTASIDNLPIDIVSGIIDFTIPSGTSITTKLKTNYSSGGASMKESIIDFSNNTPIYYDAVLRSRSNQTNDTARSVDVTIELGSTDNTCSPKVQIDPASLVISSALINSNTTNEYSANSSGSALAKYVSRPATLKEDANAEDIFVYITAYRPVGTDIKAYVKLLSRTDSRTLNDVDWSELVIDTNSTLYSSTTNPKDYKEYRFVPRTKPESTLLTGTGQYVTISTYANTQANATFNSNTGVNSTDEFITLSTQPFTSNNLVQYLVSAGNTAVTGLSNAAYYYVVFANSTGVKLSSTLGGTAVNITATSTSETGHKLQSVAETVSANIVGVDTTWNVDLVANDVIIATDSLNGVNYDVGVVASVTNSTLITLKSPLTKYDTGAPVNIEKMTYKKQAFKYQNNDGIIRYFDGTMAAQDTFYQFAVKLVMTRSVYGVTPVIDDVRVISTSV